MGDGRHIGDGGDLQTDGLHRTHGGLTTRTWALHADFDLLEAVTHRLAAGILADDLTGVGGALAATLEVELAGGGPADDVTLEVGDAHHRVVEGGGDVHDARADVLAAFGFEDFDLLVVAQTQFGKDVAATLGLLLDGGSLGSLDHRSFFHFFLNGFFSHVRLYVLGGYLGLLGADGLLATLAGAGVGAGTLAAHGQPLAVADAAQAVDAGQALERHLLLAAQVTLDEDAVARDSLNNFGQLRVGEGAGAQIRGDTGLLQHLLRGRRPDAVDVAQGGLDALLVGDFDTEKTSHGGV